MRQRMQRISRSGLHLLAAAGILACSIFAPGPATQVPPAHTDTVTPTSTITPTIPPSATRDPRITYPQNQHLYLYVITELNWHDARDYCAAKGGHLVTIDSASENDFVYGMTRGNTWLGATDEVQEGNWVWVTGETWSYTNWDEGEPNNCCPPTHCGGNDCSPEHYLTYSTEPGDWNDIPNIAMRFVCEWETQ